MNTPEPPKLPDYLSDLVDAAMNGPYRPRHMLQLSRILAEMNQLPEAETLANWVLEHDSDNLVRAFEAINILHDEGLITGGTAALKPADYAIDANALDADGISLALSHLQQYGLVQIDRVYSDELITHIRSELLEQLGDPDQGRYDEGALDLGGRRYIASLELKNAFNDPDYYANPNLIKVLNAVFRKVYVLNAFGCSVALSGCDEQRFHCDHPSLFGDPDQDKHLPVYAVNVFTPVMDMNRQNGTTKFFVASHLASDAIRRNDAGELIDGIIEAEVPAGSALIYDYRLFHAGTGNPGDNVRPLPYLFFSKPWFRDMVNFDKHQPLNMPSKELNKVPEELKARLNLAK